MLVAAVKLEVAEAEAVTDCKEIVDPDLVDARQAEHESLQTTSNKKPKKNSSSSHEELTLALLRALPDLLMSFKSETPVMQSLTTLPQYFRKCEQICLVCYGIRPPSHIYSFVFCSSKCIEPLQEKEGVSVPGVQSFNHLS